jgi:hypothetical protein
MRESARAAAAAAGEGWAGVAAGRVRWAAAAARAAVRAERAAAAACATSRSWGRAAPSREGPAGRGGSSPSPTDVHVAAGTSSRVGTGRTAATRCAQNSRSPRPCSSAAPSSSRSVGRRAVAAAAVAEAAAVVEAAAAPGAEAALPAAILRRRLRAGPQARRRGARAARPRRSWRGHTATTRATICDDVPQDSASCKIDRYRKRNARPGPRTTSEVVLCNKTTIALYATNEQQYATRSLLSRQELAGRPGRLTHSLHDSTTGQSTCAACCLPGARWVAWRR